MLPRIIFAFALFVMLIASGLTRSVEAVASSRSASGTNEPAQKIESIEKEIRCDEFNGVRVPRYHVFGHFRNTREDGSEVMELRISMAARNFTEEKVAAVACELRHRYKRHAAVYVWMVDNERVAKHTRGWDAYEPQTQTEFRVHLGIVKSKNVEETSFSWFPNRDDRQHAVEVTLR